MIFNFYVCASAPMPEIQFSEDVQKPQQELIKRFILSLLTNQTISLGNISCITISKIEDSWFHCKLGYEGKKVAFAFMENVLDAKIESSVLKQFQKYFTEEEWNRIPNDIKLGNFSCDGKNVGFKSWILSNESYYITISDEISDLLLKNIDFQWINKLAKELGILDIKEIVLFSGYILISTSFGNFYSIDYDDHFLKSVQDYTMLHKEQIHLDTINPIGDLHHKTFMGLLNLGSLSIEGQKITFTSHMIQKENPTIIWENYKANRKEYAQEQQNILSFINGLYKLLPDKEGVTIIEIDNMKEIHIIYNEERKINY